MFKWTKNRPKDEPSTPKLRLMSLPGSPVERQPSNPWHPDHSQMPTMASMLNDVIPVSRPKPLPLSAVQPGTGPAPWSSSMMQRTVSTSHYADRPPQPSRLNPTYYDNQFAAPVTQFGHEQAVPVTGEGVAPSHHRDKKPLKSILKRGKDYKPQPLVMNPPPTTTVYVGYPERRRTVSENYRPGDEFNVHARQYSNHYQGLHGDHGAHAPPAQPPETRPKYVKPYLKQSVPQKEEAIHLSWPLVGYRTSRSRQKNPLMYFDVAFDPRNPYNVRKKTVGAYTSLTPEELHQPVSTHCTVTEMTIVCRDTPYITYMEWWPIVARRKEGLRVIDVFKAIYDCYDHFLTLAELHKIDEAYLRRCERHFLKRCDEADGIPEVNRRQGMKRVDMLRGSRVFDGLVRDRATATWNMVFDDIHEPLNEMNGRPNMYPYMPARRY